MNESSAEAVPPGPQAHFVAALATTGNVTAAARQAGKSRSWAYALRNRDPEFAAAWADAQEAAVDALEAEARRRAVEGIEQPLLSGGKFVRNDDGSVATIRHYSDRLLEFLLRAHRPALFGGKSGAALPAAPDAESENGPLSLEARVMRVKKLLARGRARQAGEEPEA